MKVYWLNLLLCWHRNSELRFVDDVAEGVRYGYCRKCGRRIMEIKEVKDDRTIPPPERSP